ncbi:hypothetical protein [Halorubrum amylolyticum]|uniref:hypothetical protein n=1 Tax=Halorubrum amylolyticum TaxID=2508724 RepID=UPI001008BB43|nr:hypothetical protein [Halorubrum amylolyticum]
MANRRKFIAGLGALATGSAAAMGTGAFTSVEAQRSVSVNTAGDANAYLGFSSDNDFVTNDNGDQLSIDLGGPGNGEGGLGFNRNAATVVPEVFRITNQGQDPVDVSLEYSGDGSVVEEVDDVGLDNSEGVYFEVSDDGGESTIYPGNYTTVDVAVVQKNGNSVSGGTLTINADKS